MDPFSLFALALSAAGFFGRAERNEALQLRNAAARRLRDAQLEAHAQGHRTSSSLTWLVRERFASATWLCPRIQRAARRLGKRGELLQAGRGLFAGRTSDELRRLMSQARRLFPSFRAAGDGAVLVASTLAVALKGLEYLDSAGDIAVPWLHGSVGDVISHAPIDGADGVAHGLGSLADFPMADLVADGLVVFGIFRLVRNMRNAKAYSADASRHDSEVERVRHVSAELKVLESETEFVRQAQHEATYQAFRATMMAEILTEQAGRADPALRRRVMTQFQASAQAWWKTLQQSPQRS